jgi:hypothetical protein
VNKVSYGSRLGRIHSTVTGGGTQNAKSAEEVVREIKQAQLKQPAVATYREKALALYGLLCARCGREFENDNRQLLTVHHKDGNHLNNPPDGSNWEPLCVYCHEDVHSRGILGDYIAGAGGGRESSLVYQDQEPQGGGTLADKLKKALADKAKSRP